MSEWLTTGAMIDRLKVGEMAECESTPSFYKYVVRNSNGLYWCGKNGKYDVKHVEVQGK